ncbi:hypothetical protein TWF506_005813 [Arthrobotrys conoides]|uniref:Uncharacterized protein n=1 Tax=Arthrobotrys conoides TaxID=74498 RepID=A0AAN8NKD8_9PEZI
MFHQWPHSPSLDTRINIRDVIAVLEKLPPQPDDRDFYNPFTEEEPETAEEILRRIRALNEPLLPVIPYLELSTSPFDIYGIWADDDDGDTSKNVEVPQKAPLAPKISPENHISPLMDHIGKQSRTSKKKPAPVLLRRTLKSRGANTKYRDMASYRTQHTLRPIKETMGARVRKNRRQ